MKKILCGVLVLVVGLSVQHGLARAEMKPMSPAEAAAMQAKINSLKAAVAQLETQVAMRNLERALGSLTVLMSQMRSKLASQKVTVQEKEVLGMGLVGVTKRLLAVGNALPPSASPKPSVASPPLATVSAPPVVAKLPGDVKASVETMKVEESPVGVAGELTKPVAEGVAAKETQTASLSGSSRSYGPIVIALVVIAVIAFAFWRGREKKRDEEVAQTLPQSPQF
jgi:cbb3-type cytochrome oxidase subunit 3